MSPLHGQTPEVRRRSRDLAPGPRVRSRANTPRLPLSGPVSRTPGGSRPAQAAVRPRTPGPSPTVPPPRAPGRLSRPHRRGRAHEAHSLSAAPVRLPRPPRPPHPARPGHAQPMRRGGAAQGPGCCPRLARPLAALCTPPGPGRQARGAGRAARGEGPRAAGGLQRGRASRSARDVRAPSRRRRPPTPAGPGLRARSGGQAEP